MSPDTPDHLNPEQSDWYQIHPTNLYEPLSWFQRGSCPDDKENQGFLVIYGLNENNSNLIRIAKLDKVLLIAPTQKEAIDLLILGELERDLSEGEN